VRLASGIFFAYMVATPQDCWSDSRSLPPRVTIESRSSELDTKTVARPSCHH
jgi:hypothetical protein